MKQLNMDKAEEALVINSVKINLLGSYAKILQEEGQMNLRKLLLVPISSLEEFYTLIEFSAPELKTIFFKELARVLTVIEEKNSSYL